MQPEAKQPKPTQACGEGAPTGVRLLYASEWAQPVLHFRVGVNAWQDQPLQALRSSNGKWQVSGRCALKGAERNQSTRLVWLLALAHFLPLLSPVRSGRPHSRPHHGDASNSQLMALW
jgi:hypothetical protein